MIIQNSLEFLTISLSEAMRDHSRRVHTEKWQGYDISKRPEAEMHELLNVYIESEMIGELLDSYRKAVEPNLPWADDHFAERVGGEPVNPGKTWQTWPWALKADQARRFQERFSHTYMERYWPKYAGENAALNSVQVGKPQNWGHWFAYGDLDDVVNLLEREPLTRQAYLPIFFPEDTGARHGDRVPCTLGYHWIVRDRKLHTFYPIRSCDFYRHFRDDVYLTARLTLWILERLRVRGHDFWDTVSPGSFNMWIGSLHMFRNDYTKFFGG